MKVIWWKSFYDAFASLYRTHENPSLDGKTQLSYGRIKFSEFPQDPKSHHQVALLIYIQLLYRIYCAGGEESGITLEKSSLRHDIIGPTFIEDDVSANDLVAWWMDCFYRRLYLAYFQNRFFLPSALEVSQVLQWRFHWQWIPVYCSNWEWTFSCWGAGRSPQTCPRLHKWTPDDHRRKVRPSGLPHGPPYDPWGVACWSLEYNQFWLFTGWADARPLPASGGYRLSAERTFDDYYCSSVFLLLPSSSSCNFSSIQYFLLFLAQARKFAGQLFSCSGTWWVLLAKKVGEQSNLDRLFRQFLSSKTLHLKGTKKKLYFALGNSLT